MFEARISENREILLSGRFDASQVEKAKAVFDTITQSGIVDFEDLEYISSAGLGGFAFDAKEVEWIMQQSKINKHE